jgi:hypothetical protein
VYQVGRDAVPCCADCLLHVELELRDTIDSKEVNTQAPHAAALVKFVKRLESLEEAHNIQELDLNDQLLQMAVIPANVQ